MKGIILILAVGLCQFSYGNSRLKLLGARAEKSNQKTFELVMKDKGALVKELNARNASYASLKRDPKSAPADIAKRDKEWRAWSKGGAKPSWVATMEKSNCHRNIEKIVKADTRVAEVFITDAMGANLCAYPATSDYDQGDEAKWFKPFLNAMNPFHGDVEKDESTKNVQLQSSFLIKDGAKNVGVAIIGSRFGMSSH